MKFTSFIASILVCSWPVLSLASGFPFIVQAPTGNWKDSRLQNGCEEASAIMAVAWSRDEVLPSGKLAEKYITDMADWELRRYGVSNDTSAADTAARLLKAYQDFSDYEVNYHVSLHDLKRLLQDGKVVIAPMDGKKLKNPYFSNNGPDLHMLLIIGYDEAKKEFITNDPGTRRGKGYRYAEKRLYEAIRDYPTSQKKIVKDLGKNVISITKSLSK